MAYISHRLGNVVGGPAVISDRCFRHPEAHYFLSLFKKQVLFISAYKISRHFNSLLSYDGIPNSQPELEARQDTHPTWRMESMKFKIVISLNLFLLIACFAAAQKPCGPTITPLPSLFVNWPQFHYDAAHSGCNPYETILSPSTVGNLTTDWTYLNAPGAYTSPVVANGLVYVGMTGSQGQNTFGTLYAVNARTGTLSWQYSLLSYDDGIHYTPAVANGIVYFTTDNGGLYALDANTGDFIWGQSGNYSPTVANGVVYAGHGSFLYAYDAKTGNTLWVNNQIYIGGSSPAVANGILYVGSLDYNLYALNATTGALLWKYATGSIIESSPTVAGNVVYVGSDDSNLYALNATTGALLWKYAANSYVQDAAAVADGVVYFGTCCDQNVYALNAKTGALLWKYAADSSVESSPMVANGVLYFADHGKGSFYALNASTGDLLWKQTGTIFTTSSPAVANGIAYFGEDKLYAFHLPGH